MGCIRSEDAAHLDSTFMKYDITFPVAVSKTNGTDMPFPVNLTIKIEAVNVNAALARFTKELQDLMGYRG